MAWSFDGLTGYVGVETVPVAAAPLTMACWFRKSASAASFQQLISVGNPSTLQLFSLNAGNGVAGVVSALTAGTSADRADSTTTFATGQWCHGAAVFASSIQRYAYLNGGGEGANTTAVVPAGVSRTDVGRGAFSYFAGDVAEAAVWNAALTDEEIALLARGFSPLCLWQRLPNLVMYQDLIRPLNRPGIGPAMTASGGTSVAAHPRLVYPASCLLGGVPLLYAVPYRSVAAVAQAGRAAQGAAALAGAEQGTTYPTREVSS